MKTILENWQTIAAVVAPIVAWLGGRRLKKIEIKEKETSALNELQNVYDRYIEHDKTRTTDLIERMKTLENSYTSLKSENLMQRRENLELNATIRAWEAKYHKLDEKYATLLEAHSKLKKEFENYKKRKK